MIVIIPNYCYGPLAATLINNKERLSAEQKPDLNYLTCSNHELWLLPQNIRLSSSPEIVKNFEVVQDFSVFEIDENGRAILYYDDGSDDNAFVVTNACNSSCIMCPTPDGIRKHGGTASLEKLLRIVRQMPSDPPHLTITGGEPFLFGRDIFPFFSSLKEKFITTDFLLLTNGRIFSIPDYCVELKKTLPQRTIIGIPIHGFDEVSHDSITRAPGSFVQTQIGIKNLLSLGFYIEIRIVVSKLNAAYIDKIADLICKEFPTANCVKIMGLEMFGNAAHNEKDVWIPYRQAFLCVEPAIKTLISHGIDVALYNFPLCSVDQGYWSICRKSISDYKVRYAKDCDACKVRDACGGIFSGTIRLAEKDVIPVRR